MWIVGHRTTFQKMNKSSIDLVNVEVATLTAKPSVLCPMLIGSLLSLNGTSVIACVSAVHIIYELYKDT